MDLFNEIRFGIKIMESLACITGFICWARLYPRFWRYFPFYLLIITYCEFAGWYMNGHGIKGSKAMYNYFVIPLEFLFMHFLYYQNLPPRFKKIIISMSVIYILCWLTERLFLQHFTWVWMSFSYTIGNITILVSGIIYFFQLLNSEKLVDYKKQIFYWVNLGLLIFYVGTFPYYAIFKTLYETEPELFKGLSWLQVITNYIMYAFFIVGFLCTNTKKK